MDEDLMDNIIIIMVDAYSPFHQGQDFKMFIFSSFLVQILDQADPKAENSANMKPG